MLIKGSFVVYVLLNICYATAFFVYPPWAAQVLVLAGRGPECQRKEGLQAFARRCSQKDIERRVLSQSRLVRRDPDGLQLMETPKGKFWEPVIDGTVIVPQIAEFEAKYTGFPRPIHPGDIVLDCGANVGAFTREAVDEGATVVVAIEPAPNNVESLRRNFAAEIAAGKVIVYPKGVWDKDDFLTLAINNTTSAMDSFVIHEDTHPGITVPLTTIDKLVAELKLPREWISSKTRARRGAKTLIAYHPRMEISVDHLPEGPQMVPVVIRQIQPNYRIECLDTELHRKQLRLDAGILYFY
jgi:FkbM family methyltransferase